MKPFLFFLILLSGTFIQAQNLALPYRAIPDYPEKYTAETVAARMVDGLGFRYYWATEGLGPKDLTYRPNEESRTTRETIEHIHGLSIIIVNGVRKAPQESADVSDWPFEILRKATLENLAEAGTKLKSGKVSLEELLIYYENSDRTFPFWNQINGPIADALWHCGQVVSFRRSSGNPFNPNVSVFSGKVRE